MQQRHGLTVVEADRALVQRNLALQLIKAKRSPPGHAAVDAADVHAHANPEVERSAQAGIEQARARIAARREARGSAKMKLKMKLERATKRRLDGDRARSKRAFLSIIKGGPRAPTPPKEKRPRAAETPRTKVQLVLRRTLLDSFEKGSTNKYLGQEIDQTACQLRYNPNAYHVDGDVVRVAKAELWWAAERIIAPSA